MSSDGVEFDERLGPILDELLLQSRLGIQPNIDDYQQRFPDLAKKISELHETIFLIETNVCPQQGQPNSTPATPTLQQLGEYRIVQEIGRGGMGIVYEAIQESLDRRVAIKVLPNSKVLTGDQIKRFQREAKAAGQLRHPNIVGVIDVGEESGVHFYVMQFINGISLDHLLTQLRSASEQASHFPLDLILKQYPSPSIGNQTGDFKPKNEADLSSASSQSIQFDSKARYFRTIARLGKSTAEALDFAHRNGVLHRDIKPSNLLLDENDEIWITDFGLAKFGDDQLTQTGDLVGTLRYMPPERLRGWSDPRSDVYSLGLTIYELVTLQRGFESDDRVEVLKKIQSDQPIAPRKIDSGIPTDLETIILTSIAKEPNRRYSSAIQMAKDFERFLEGRPILARRSTVRKRLWLWCRRKPVVASLAALAILLLVSIAAGSTIFAIKLNEQVNKVVDANELADTRLFDAYVAQVEALRISQTVGSRKQAIDTIKNAVQIVGNEETKRFRLRNNAIAVLGMYDIEEVVAWDRETVGCDWFHASLDQDISKIAQINKDQYIEIFDFETGRCQVLRDQPQISVDLSRLLLSPDGKRLAFGGLSIKTGHFVFRLVDLETNRTLISKTRNLGDFLQSIECTNDGLLIAYIEAGDYEQSKAAVICKLADGEIVKRIQGGTSLSSLSFSSDGKLLLVNRGFRIDVVDTATWTTRYTINPVQSAELATWDANDRSIIVTSKRGMIEFWVLDGEQFVVSESSPKYINATKQINVSSHPRFPVVVTTGLDGQSAVWSTSSGRRRLVTNNRHKSFSKDGERLAYSNRNGSFGVGRLVCPQAAKRLELPEGEFVMGRLSFSKSGKRLAVVGLKSGRTTIFETETGQLLLRESKQDNSNGIEFFSPESENQMLLFRRNYDKTTIGLCELKSSDMGLSPFRLMMEQKKTLLGAQEHWFATSFELDSKKTIFALLSDTAVKLLSWPDCKVQDSIPLEGEAFRYISLSPSGTQVAVSDYNSLRLFVYDLTERKIVFDLTPSQQGLSRSLNNGSVTEYSKDGTLLVVSTPDAFRVYSTNNWTLVKKIERREPGVGYATFSDQYLAVADSGFVGLYRIEDFELLAELEAPTPVRFSSVSPDELPMLTFSPSGRFLAGGTMENEIMLWDLPLLRNQLSELGLDWSNDRQPLHALPTSKSD